MAVRRMIQKFLDDQKETIARMRRMLEGTHQQISKSEAQDIYNATTTLKLDSPLTFLQLEHEVRLLAYDKWEKAGRPPGDGKQFWIDAEQELFGPNPLEKGGYLVYVRNKRNGWDLTKVAPDRRATSC